jgi:hypothetical protein
LITHKKDLHVKLSPEITVFEKPFGKKIEHNLKLRNQNDYYLGIGVP